MHGVRDSTADSVAGGKTRELAEHRQLLVHDEDAFPRRASQGFSRCQRKLDVGYRMFDVRALSRIGPVAQRLEQGTHNPLVPGSNPGGPSPESFLGLKPSKSDYQILNR